MDGFGVSDLSRNFNLRQVNIELNRSLTQLSSEIVTGRASDTTLRLNGHFSFLTQIETDLRKTENRSLVLNEIAVSFEAQQTALGYMSEAANELFDTLAIATTDNGAVSLQNLATQARGFLDGIVSALNSNQGERHLFAGTTVDQSALASADTLMSDLTIALSGATTAADALALADDFFDAPGGVFETAIYLGSDQTLAPTSIGDGETITLGLRADDPAFRALLKSVTLMAISEDSALILPESARNDLSLQQIDPLLSARDGITSLRAQVGFQEERVERKEAQLQSEKTSLQLTRGELLDVDPFETASALEAVRQQLETLYTITARTSNLSLVNFLS